MYDRIRQLEIANAKTDTQYGQIMETLGALKVEISALKEKPARRWESIITWMPKLQKKSCWHFCSAIITGSR